MTTNDFKKILFCHIPKCAGTNVNTCLEKSLKDNYEWYIHRILKFEIEKYKKYYKFSVVRDPVQRIVSLYFYQTNLINELIAKKALDFQEGNWQTVHDLYKKYKITDIYSFLNNFKTFYEKEIQPFIDRLKTIQERKCMTYFFAVGYFPQHLFICDNNDNILVDDIVSIKNVDSFLANKFKIDSASKTNTHEHSNDCYDDYVTESNRKDIMNIYQKDYDIFSHLFK